MLSRSLAGVGGFFFFLGWVVFEGFKIDIPTGEVSPYVIIGFMFLFSALIVEFRGAISKFLNAVIRI